MKLLIEDDQGNRSVVPVIRDEITIGRKEGNTIRLTERNVSRRHARLVRNNGKLYVEDVEARYGVKKNGQEIDQRAEFSEGDVVLIGDYRLTLRPEKAKSAQPADGDDVAAEISPELQDGQLDEEVDRALEDEPTQVQEVDEVEGAPAEESKPAAARSDTKIIETEPAELVVVSSNFAGQEFPLDRDEMVIGRGEDCDIIIDHRSVSNTHAKILREGPETYKIVDLNSRNGVKVSGEEYKSAHLERGDVIQLGHVKFRFVEPGENYVFSPQEHGEQIPAEGRAGASLRPMVVGAGALAVLVAVVGGYLLLSGGDQGDANPKADGPRAETKTPKTGGTAAPKEGPGSEEKGGGRVDKVLANAESNIESGRLEEAIGALESTREALEPTGEQNKRIDELLSKARNEQPFRRRYTSAKQALKHDAPKSALEDLGKIPDHSVFRDLVEQNDLRKKALDALLDQSRAALDEKNYEEAKKFADKAFGYESHKQEAESLLEKIAETKSKMAEKGGAEGEPVAGKDQSGSGSGRATATESSGSAGSRPEPEPEPGVSAAQAKKLYDSAMSKTLQGDTSGAISDCLKALRAGHTACHRVLGMAYKKQGNKTAACRHFSSYLATGPSDGARIRSMMADLGCK